MTDPANASQVPTPQEEMDALVAKVAALTDLSLEMTRLCVSVQRVVPGIALATTSLDLTCACLTVQTQIPPAFTAAAVVAAAAGVSADAAAVLEAQADLIWARGIALTPDQLEAVFPAGVSDELPWQVVTIGRDPGLYASADAANAQILGVPNAFRQKKSTRLEALAFYRHRYETNRVEKWIAVPGEETRE